MVFGFLGKFRVGIENVYRTLADHWALQTILDRLGPQADMVCGRLVRNLAESTGLWRTIAVSAVLRILVKILYIFRMSAKVRRPTSTDF